MMRDWQVSRNHFRIEYYHNITKEKPLLLRKTKEGTETFFTAITNLQVLLEKRHNDLDTLMAHLIHHMDFKMGSTHAFWVGKNIMYIRFNSEFSTDIRTFPSDESSSRKDKLWRVTVKAGKKDVHYREVCLVRAENKKEGGKKAIPAIRSAYPGGNTDIITGIVLEEIPVEKIP